MNVGHFVVHGCSRAMKLACAQREYGFKTYAVNRRMPEEFINLSFDLAARIAIFYDSDHTEIIPEELIHRVVKEMDSKVDLWHCHNQPDWIVPMVKSVSKKPVIYDVHDLNSTMYPKRDNGLEKLSFELADGVMAVGENQKNLIRYKIGPDKPVMSYESRIPASWYPEPKDPAYDLVYQGGLSVDEGSCRNWTTAFRYLQNELTLRVYPAEKEMAYSYAMHCVDVEMPLPYFNLFNVISRAQAGLVGYAEQTQAYHEGQPNKFYEYLACGIPVIALNAPQLEPIIIKHNIGVCVAEYEDIPYALNHIKQSSGMYRAAALNFRKDFTMDKQMPKIAMFYKMVMDRVNHA